MRRVDQNTLSADIIVVGAGIIGLMTAKSLSDSGYKVFLLDQQKIGQEASRAGGGILASLTPWQQDPDVAELMRRSQKQYFHLANELFDSTGIDCEYQKSGLIVLDQAITPAIEAWMTQSTPKPQLLTPQQAQQYRNSISVKSHAIFQPNTAQIRNPKLIAAIKQYLINKPGVRLFEDTPVERLETKNNKIISARAKGDRYVAEKFVITAGAWSKKIMQLLNMDVPIKPVRGQMLRLKPKKQPLQQIILKSGHYLIPRKNGTILAGSTLEDTAFDKQTTEEARIELWQKTLDMCPTLSTAQLIDHWAGLRPANALPKPIIEQVHCIDNAYLCAGHFRYGLTCAPASAVLIKSLITAERNQDPLLNAFKGPYSQTKEQQTISTLT